MRCALSQAGRAIEKECCHGLGDLVGTLLVRAVSRAEELEASATDISCQALAESSWIEPVVSSPDDERGNLDAGRLGGNRSGVDRSSEGCEGAASRRRCVELIVVVVDALGGHRRIAGEEARTEERAKRRTPPELPEDETPQDWYRCQVAFYASACLVAGSVDEYEVAYQFGVARSDGDRNGSAHAVPDKCDPTEAQARVEVGHGFRECIDAIGKAVRWRFGASAESGEVQRHESKVVAESLRERRPRRVIEEEFVNENQRGALAVIGHPQTNAAGREVSMHTERHGREPCALGNADRSASFARSCRRLQLPRGRCHDGSAGCRRGGERQLTIRRPDADQAIRCDGLSRWMMDTR